MNDEGELKTPPLCYMRTRVTTGAGLSMGCWRTLLLTALYLLFAGSFAFSLPTAEITATGTWSRTLSSADLSGGPGTDFPLQIDQGTPVATFVSFDELSGTSTWRCRLAMTTASWSPTVTLWVRRISNHTGVTGGTNWQQVTTTAAELFRATEDAANIQIEYRFDNLDVTAGPGVFTTTITWTTTFF